MPYPGATGFSSNNRLEGNALGWCSGEPKTPPLMK
eukprot:CAMPEP_0195586726 /NCGR_PEP_ID=MMETSP0814-20130614/29814_1 /TAXON_ID=97485 /ORGANISM="Prymnesium parvum, Strain Texoma1" /LENGTH=34 /DNA_ID= /DNA_START= /DNA_END= /DNA_ORIENTATION=